jgi:hypothetical protein
MNKYIPFLLLLFLIPYPIQSAKLHIGPGFYAIYIGPLSSAYISSEIKIVLENDKLWAPDEFSFYYGLYEITEGIPVCLSIGWRKYFIKNLKFQPYFVFGIPIPFIGFGLDYRISNNFYLNTYATSNLILSTTGISIGYKFH